MALDGDDDIFKETELPLIDEDEDEPMEDDEDEELDALEKDNKDDDMDDENDNDNDNDEDEEVDGEPEEDEEDEADNDENENENTGDGETQIVVEDGNNLRPDENKAPKETNLNSRKRPEDEDSETQKFYNLLALKARLASTYDMNPIVAIPYSSQIHSIALSKSSKWLFTGGEDGYIRRYDFFGSIDGDVQLTAAQKHSLVDLITNGGSLLGYWENEIPVKRTTLKSDSYDPFLSPVYSLAVESKSLWLLSGLSNGGINLQSVRHNEGAIIHHFKKHTDTVSVLDLNETQTNFVSGSWDKQIYLWDLNNGHIVRSFTESTGQITSIQYRPAGGMDIEQVKQQQVPVDDDDLDSLFGSDDPAKESEGQETTPSLKDVNVFMSAAVDGSVYVWDIRDRRPALKIKTPKGTPPWCVSACWSDSGDSIYVGRRNSTVEEFSLRMPFYSGGDSRPSKVLKFPQVSGAVTVVKALPNRNHVICGSHDNIRVYDLRLYPEAAKKTPFLIVPGHHGGVLSDVIFDPTYRYMISASGNRGWQGLSTETVFIYNVGSD